MSTDSLGQDAAVQPDPASESAANPGCLQPAIPLDIMADQLDYLASHKSPACSPACRDCWRLEQVTYWLLLPFRTDAGPTLSQAHYHLKWKSPRHWGG